MDLGRGLESTSGTTTSGEEMEQADREMEAAEALADLAHLAVRESSSGEGLWGSKRKRAQKRVKSESPPSNQDRATLDEQHGGQSCLNVMINPPKADPDLDLAKPALSCARNCPSPGSGRSRQNLSEAEKEARRHRRILANRESARQTIRRRQALCEDLAKKAASLTSENEKLKREKDLALKEFQSLELTNKHLKAQMKVIKVEMESSLGDNRSSRADLPTTSSNCPIILYSHHPFSSLRWPPIIQSPNPVQSFHGPRDAITVPSNIPVPANEKLDSWQQQTENPVDVNALRTPLYVLPCPWLFPVPDSWNGYHRDSCLGFTHPQDGTCAHNPCSGSSSSKAVVQGDGQCSLHPVGVKSEATSSVELRVIDDLNETPAGFALDGGDHCAVPQPNPTSSFRNETGPVSEYNSRTNGACAKDSQTITSLPVKVQELFKLSNTKLVDAAAAAEARRRRKELTKLKNLHSRQCRMNC